MGCIHMCTMCAYIYIMNNTWVVTFNKVGTLSKMIFFCLEKGALYIIIIRV